MRDTRRRRRAFTLMELLVVMGVISALAALALPLFTDQLNAWRRRTDMATARDAYAAAHSEYLMSGMTGERAFYYYDAGTGKVSSTAPSSTYGKWDHEADYAIGGVDMEGNAAQAGYVTVSFNDDGSLHAIAWGDAGEGELNVIAGTQIADGWWSHSTQRQASFERLQTISNAVRKARDIRILQGIAIYFSRLDEEEAHKILGDLRWNRIVNNHGEDQLFEYGQDPGGSIRIKGVDTSYTPYFDYVGYDARVFASDGYWDIVDGLQVGTNNYLNKYLFTSDELLSTTYGTNDWQNSIRIKFDVVDGKVTNVHMWISSKNGADLSDFSVYA